MFDDLEVDLPALADSVGTDRGKSRSLRSRRNYRVQDAVRATARVRPLIAYRRNKEALFIELRESSAHRIHGRSGKRTWRARDGLPFAQNGTALVRLPRIGRGLPATGFLRRDKGF